MGAMSESTRAKWKASNSTTTPKRKGKHNITTRKTPNPSASENHPSALRIAGNKQGSSRLRLADFMGMGEGDLFGDDNQVGVGYR